MTERLMNVLAWVLGFLFSCLFIWAASAVFMDGVTPKVWDSTVQRYVHAPGSTIRHRSEGWGELHVAEHGLPQQERQVFFSPDPKFFFWGDSFAEGMQVEAAERAVNLYNARAHGSMPKGVTIADSGLSMADFYFFIPRYERLTDNVTAHVFFLPGFRPILPGHSLDCHSRFLPSPWRFEESHCPPSGAALEYSELLSRTRLDFLHTVYRSVADYNFRFSVGNLTQDQPVVRKAAAAPSLRQLEEGWTFLLRELKKETRGRLVFLYTPLRPDLESGNIRLEDETDIARKVLFSRLCSEAGADFVDLTGDFLELYRHTGRLAMGFFNTPQGSGHINAEGQALIAQGLYRYFSGAAR